MADFSSLSGKIFSARAFACISIVFFVFQLVYHYRFPSHTSNYEPYLNGREINAAIPPDLDFVQLDGITKESIRADVFAPEGSYKEYLYGTFTEEGDGFT